MSKRKAIKTQALPMPETREEAEKLLGEIGMLQRRVGEYQAKASDRIAGISQAFAELVAPVNDQIEAKFQALHAFAEAHRKELLEGDSKTVKFTTGTLSWRFTPPAVKLTKPDAVLEQLKKRRLWDFVRTIQEVNREAILEDPTKVEGIEGIKVTSREEFVAKPLETEIERVETVTTSKRKAA